MHALELTPQPVADTRRPLLEVPSAELLAWLQAREQAPLRAGQMRRWLLIGRATSFEQMSDLPKHLRDELAAAFRPLGSDIARHLISCDGTHKLPVTGALCRAIGKGPGATITVHLDERLA